MKPTYDVAWAVRQVADNPKTKFVFFWSSRPRGDGELDTALFSQWYPAGFEAEGAYYATAEHWMMAEKARLFGDEKARADILEAATPGKAKALGRAVLGFDQAQWDANAYEIVVKRNLAKFRADSARADVLLRTGNKILVEAAPVDPIWGIGLAADAEEAVYPDLWPGTNLLGFALMQVRDALRKEHP